MTQQLIQCIGAALMDTVAITVWLTLAVCTICIWRALIAASRKDPPGVRFVHANNQKPPFRPSPPPAPPRPAFENWIFEYSTLDQQVQAFRDRKPRRLRKGTSKPKGAYE